MKKCDKEELIVFLEKENSTEQEVVLQVAMLLYVAIINNDNFVDYVRSTLLLSTCLEFLNLIWNE